MRGGARKGTGGARPDAGRKPLCKPTKPRLVRLNDEQAAMMKELGGSDWLQGQLNLAIRQREAKEAERLKID